MRKSLMIAMVLATASLALACSDDQPGADAGPAADGQTAGDASFPNKPGGNPLVPEVAAFPFPSDFYLQKDAASETGYRVKIPQQALHKNIPAKLFSAADGFSRVPIILAYLTGGIDKKSLPDPDDPALTVGDKSPVYLVKVGTWARVPILIELDMMADDDTSRALILRPLTLLDEKSQYVVLVRARLKTLAGKPHVAGAAFAALRDGVATSDADIEKQRGDFKQVTAAIKALKLQASEVVLGWTFRTRSDKQVTGALVAIQDAMNAAPLGDVTITSDKIEKGTKTNRQIVASFSAPNFVGTDGKITLDSGGKPKQHGTRKVTFGLTIPSTVDAARPVVLYGHGFMGGWIQGTRGSWNDIATKYKYNTAATNLGFHDGITALLTAAIAADMTKMDTVVTEVQQSLANVTYMARLVKDKLAKTITAKDKGGKTFYPLDGTRIYYHGISNGGTFGYVVAATSPAPSRASIIVGGGGLTHFLQRAVQWGQYAPLIGMIFSSAFDQQVLMALMQLTLDPVDSMNYAPYLVTRRFPGRKPIALALHMAVNDSQVHNMVTEWVARSADIPLITPSPKKIYGLKTITAAPPAGAPTGTRAAMFVYDEKVTPSPKGNVPPKTDNGTHGTVRKLSVYQQHVSTFLETGKFIQQCKGACDPH